MDQVSNQMSLLIIAEIVLLIIVLVFIPIYSCCVGKCQSDDKKAPLKGLNMPEGSIRGMLALLSVGSFVLFLLLGPQTPGMEKYFDKVLASFGTLTGAIIGFYFGNRGSGKKPEENTSSER